MSDIMPDWSNVSLLWQYEHGSRWISHSEQKLDAINKAYNKGQKSVTLPNKDPKKQIVLYFDKMNQKNKISGWEQEVRCCVFNESFYVWQWKDDEDWYSYIPAVALELEIAFHLKKPIAKFTIKHDYEVDLSTFQQRNVKNGKVCDVKREEVEIGEKTSALKQIALAFTSYFKSKCQEHLDADSKRSNKCAAKKMKLDQSDECTIKYIVKGKVPVDPICLPLLKKSHVYSDGPTEVYDAMLNLTDLKFNNNKYYHIQMLKKDEDDDYYVWFHWGRVGANGQTKLIHFESNIAEARTVFIDKFEQKTNNSWNKRHCFTKHDGKYDLVHVDYGVKEVLPQLKKQARSSLDPKIRIIMEMISNIDEMTKQVIAMKYDIRKAPLGKLTHHQIRAGYCALKNIDAAIKDKRSKAELVEANNQFYTRIPHNFGMKAPPVISTLEEVKEKMDLLYALSSIEVAVEIKNNNYKSKNTLDFSYRNLECDLKVVENDDEMFGIIKTYLHGSHGPTHVNYTMQIVNIYECHKTSQEKNFLDVGNKILLWHGSRITNFFSILKRGLLIAPPEAPSTGYMFGKGLYFADVSSKSANYCHATKKNNDGLLLLCEVSLGEENVMLLADDNANVTTIARGMNSVKAPGIYTPHNSGTIMRSDVKIPLGELNNWEENPLVGLRYNEYVVYNPNQVKLKYLLHVKFMFK